MKTNWEDFYLCKKDYNVCHKWLEIGIQVANVFLTTV